MKSQLVLILALTVTTGVLASCASEFAEDPTRPRPTRAVESPVDQASASGEIRPGNNDTMPLVKITDSDKKNEPPQVYTIIDGVHDLTVTTATTRPKTEPAILPAPTRIDPVFGPNH